MKSVQRAGESSLQCHSDGGRRILLKGKEDIMGFQRFDHREPVARLNITVEPGFAAFAAHFLGFAKNFKGFVNPVARTRPQS